MALLPGELYMILVFILTIRKDIALKILICNI